MCKTPEAPNKPAALVCGNERTRHPTRAATLTKPNRLRKKAISKGCMPLSASSRISVFCTAVMAVAASISAMASWPGRSACSGIKCWPV
jgi:hypothetical protein